MEYKNIRFERDGSVAVVTIERPKALNALNHEAITELHDCFDGIAKDDSVRCVIITGGGEKAFVAGADIGEMAGLDETGGRKLSERGQALFFKIERLAQPVIAAVNGFALGGGCELAMACDIRLASENAKLGQPEVNLGIIPGYGGTQRLPRLVGPGMAMRLTLTGDIVNAAEAFRIGLVDEIYPAAELITKARELAQKVVSKGPLAIRAAKQAINAALDLDIDTGARREAELFGALFTSEDQKEGMKAFLEKRKAEFKGK
jgi:enoyl-CoA hydratase